MQFEKRNWDITAVLHNWKSLLRTEDVCVTIKTVVQKLWSCDTGKMYLHILWMFPHLSTPCFDQRWLFQTQVPLPFGSGCLYNFSLFMSAAQLLAEALEWMWTAQVLGEFCTFPLFIALCLTAIVKSQMSWLSPWDIMENNLASLFSVHSWIQLTY